jgi:hypothetical protein
MITHCPICRYSLEGLPERHRCPECAFEYDKSETAFHPPPRGRVWWLGFYVGLVGAAALAFVYWYFPGRVSLFPAFYFTMLLLGSFRRQQKAEGCAVIVSDGRVDEIEAGKIARSHSLNGVDGAAWSFVNGRIRLYWLDEVRDSFRLTSQVYPNKVAKAVGQEIHRRVSARDQSGQDRSSDVSG